MRRTYLFWLLALGAFMAFLPCGHSQMSEEEKKQLFLRAREDIRPVPKPQASATPRPKPKTVSTPTPRPSPRATPEPKSEPKSEPEEAPRGTPPPGDSSDNILEPGRPGREKPRPTAAPEPKGAEPTPSPAPPQPTATPAPTPSGKTPDGNRLDAPIVIEKSGLEEDEGYLPPPKSTGGWFKRWRYLTPGVRRAIDQPVNPVKKGRWKYIIVHNSGTRQGNARIFDVYHRRTRKMQNGLAYHFVIGNGSSSGDGEIEIGSRWTKQINGGHVASDYLNNIAIGVCFVGDFNRDRPTKAQMAALDELIQYVRGRVGKIKGKPAIVVPHKKINPKPTDCPGDRFPYQWMRDKFGSQ